MSKSKSFANIYFTIFLSYAVNILCRAQSEPPAKLTDECEGRGVEPRGLPARHSALTDLRAICEKNYLRLFK
jgi:hypothetical protein